MGFKRNPITRAVMSASVGAATALATLPLPARSQEPPPAIREEILAPINVEGDKGLGSAGLFEVDEGFNADFQTSATKSPVPLQDTPQSVSVITQDSLKARQAQDLGQALETAAGVNQYSGPGPFGGQSPFGFQSTQIRGVNVDPLYDIRIDGFIGLPYYAQPDLAVFERVEVIKGPSSTLYGRGSAGGFINRVTKKPKPDFAADVSASVGSYDHYRLDADVTGPLFDSERVTGRMVAAYQDADSFVDGVSSKRTLFAPSVEFEISDRTRLLLQGFYQQDDFIPNPGFPLIQEGDHYRGPDISRSLFVGVPSDDENTWKTRSGTIVLDHELDDDWLARLRLNRASSDNPIDMDSYAYVYGGVTGGDVSLYSSEFEPNTTDVWSGELRLTGDVEMFDRPATVGVGIDYSRIETHRTDRFLGLGTANLYDQNFEDFPTIEPTAADTSSDFYNDQKSTGVYAQLMVEPVERVHVLLGGRYDRAGTTSRNALADTRDAQNDDDFTGRVALSFDVRDNVSTYALYAQSFTPVTDVDADGGVLDPETGEIYEVGLKTTWLDDRLSATTALFRIERENIPVPAPGIDNNFSVSSGVQRSDGLELEINGEPLPGWNISFGGVVLDSEFTDRDDPFFGNRPAGTADWQIGAFTSYEVQGGALKGLGAGAGVFAVGDRGISSFEAEGELEGYERVDLSAFYNGFENYRFALQIRNITDETYVSGADRRGANAQFGSPTAVLFTVNRHFGAN